jgi:RNA polymerase sigma factor (sigma-70 family)
MYTASNHISNESDLIRGCIAGVRKFQEELYEMHAPKMYAVCIRYCANADDAKDVLQDGFVKVFKNVDKFRFEGSFEGWIRRIFVNTAIEHYRKKSNIYAINEQIETSIVDQSTTAFEKLAERDLLSIINELSPGYKAVFNMYVIEGYSHKEIGDILKISEGTSKSQLARAKAILQKTLREKYNID